MINYVNKNIFDDFGLDKPIQVIAHQANCLGSMGAGIAKLIGDKYPNVRNADRKHCNSMSRQLLFGTILSVPIDNSPLHVVNLYSQMYLGACNDAGRNDDFSKRTDALESALYDLLKEYENTDKQIGIPLIASGIAKDHTKGIKNDLAYFKKHIAPIVEKVFQDTQINVYYL